MTWRASDWQGLYYRHSSFHSLTFLHICTVKMSRWHRVSGYVYKLFSTAGPFISNPMGSAVRKHFLPRLSIHSYIITYYLSILHFSKELYNSEIVRRSSRKLPSPQNCTKFFLFSWIQQQYSISHVCRKTPRNSGIDKNDLAKKLRYVSDLHWHIGIWCIIFIMDILQRQHSGGSENLAKCLRYKKQSPHNKILEPNNLTSVTVI